MPVATIEPTYATVPKDIEGNMGHSNIFARPLKERSTQPAHIAGLYAPDDYPKDEVRERVCFLGLFGTWIFGWCGSDVVRCNNKK